MNQDLNHFFRKIAVAATMVAGLVLVSSNAQADVIQTIGTALANAGDASNTSAPFTVASSDHVVVASIYVDGGSPGNPINPGDNIFEFAGVAATGIIQDGGTGRGLLAYWYNPSTAPNSSVVYSDNNFNPLLLNTWVLDGIDTSVAPGTNIGTTVNTFPTGIDPSAGHLIISAANANGNPTIGSPTTTGFSVDFPSLTQGGGGGGTLAGGSLEVSSTSPVNIDWTSTSNGAPLAFAFAQAAIPEPGSCSLLALAGLGLVNRRRRV